MRVHSSVQPDGRRTRGGRVRPRTGGAGILTFIVVCLFAVLGLVLGYRRVISNIDAAQAPHYLLLSRIIWTAGCCGVLLIACLAIFGRWSVRRLLTLAVILFGSMYLFVIPPLSEPDGVSHYGSVYNNAGTILGAPEGKGYYRWLLNMRPQDTYLAREIRSPQDCELWLSSFSQGWDAGLEVPATVNLLDTMEEAHGFTQIIGIVVSSQGIYYLPASLAMAACLAMGLPYGWISMAGCVANLFIYILAVSYAVRKLPYGQRTFAIIALLPICLQQAASLSYDSILLSAAFVVTALGLRWAEPQYVFARTRAAVTEYILFAVGLLMLCLTKSGTYAPLILLPAFLNMRREKAALQKFSEENRKRHPRLAVMMRIACIVLLAAAAGYAVYRLHGLMHARIRISGYKGLKKKRPIDYLRDPAYTFSLLGATVLSEGRDWVYQTFGGRLGSLDRNLWKPFIYGIILLFLVSLIRKESEPAWKFSHRVCGVLLALIPDIVSVIAMMIYNTPDVSDIILGVQGRYFLPTLYVLGVSVFHWKRPEIRSGASRPAGSVEMLRQPAARCGMQNEKTSQAENAAQTGDVTLTQDATQAGNSTRIRSRLLGLFGLRTEYIDSMIMIVMTWLTWMTAVEALRI